MRIWVLALALAACVARDPASTREVEQTGLPNPCGNGIEELLEECDDNNFDNTDDCIIDFQAQVPYACKDAFCGDGYEHTSGTAPFEECDDGLLGNTGSPDACRPNCKLPACGDGTTDTGEECDDGDQDNTDACTTLCKLAVCGDTFVQGNEECDDGGNLDNTDGCINDPNTQRVCLDAQCGDGFVQAGVELCDDANQDNTDTCTMICAPPSCGDGFVQPPEECDDDNTVNTDSCLNSCMDARCGDSVVAFFEQCDDGNTVNTDGCIIDAQAERFCQTARCGDGYVRAGTEECDSGNFRTDSDCIIDEGNFANSCKTARCGDGYLHTAGTGPFESCDDGDADTTDFCPACNFATCGDGFVFAQSEECDDGNQLNTDGCVSNPQQKSFCDAAVCGDGFIQAGVETCDDSNTDTEDGCGATCITERCGDGFINGDETCDGSGETATCDIDCTPAVCGDGVLNVTAFEGCDEGTANSDSGSCRTNCSLPSCGDGVVDPDEQCDDGALNGTDDFSGCAPTCVTITAAARSGACNAGSGPGWLVALGLVLLVIFGRRRRGLVGGLAALGLLVLVPFGSARADGFRLGRFAPAPSLDDGLTISLPSTLDAMKYSAMLTFDFSDRPFVLKTDSGGMTRERDIIDDQLEAHANLALGLGTRFQVHVDMPFTLDQASTSGSINMQSFGADQTALGDIRLGGAARLFGERHAIGPSVGVGADLVLPSGDEQDFAGDGGVGVDLAVLGAYKLPLLTLAANIGVALRPSNDFADVRLGPEFVSRVGAVIPVGDKMNTYGELAFGVPLREQVGDPPPPVEALGGLRYRFGDWVAGAGAGVGLSDALGVPVWRALVSFGYTNQRDREEEIVIPPPVIVENKDKDGDGILDDSCDMQPEDKDAFEDSDGCPDPDNDKDEILDVADQCINDPEDKDSFKDEDGCPDPDNDDDKIVDGSDKCINEPETVNQFEDEDGCPDRIPRPTLDAILAQLADRILFEYDRADLMPDSQRVVAEVALLLTQVPELELLSIEGHASKEGSAAHNEKLSKDRAQTAYDALVAAGVAASRLKVAHFGAKKPVGAAKDEAMRKASRRVEFKVLRYSGQDMNVAPPGKGAAPAATPAPAAAPAAPAPVAPAPASNDPLEKQ